MINRTKNLESSGIKTIAEKILKKLIDEDVIDFDFARSKNDKIKAVQIIENVLDDNLPDGDELIEHVDEIRAKSKTDSSQWRQMEFNL
jgi:hypothetical protein